MKKLLSLAIMLLLLLGSLGIPAFGADAGSDSAEVYVTISNKGQLVVTQEKITVTDIDDDGALSVNDALYAVHESKYEGGSAAGYSYYMSQYGLSLGKLWGDNSGNFGYYVNNASASSLADTVKNGDFVYAFICAGTYPNLDSYSYFDTNMVSALVGSEITLTLSAFSGYDASWNSIFTPLSDAMIVIDGVATEYKTNTEGKVTLSFDSAKEYVISAASATQTLVPPVCKVSVEEEKLPAQTDNNNTETEPKEDNPGKDSHLIVICILGAVAVAAGVAVFVVIKRKKNE